MVAFKIRRKYVLELRFGIGLEYLIRRNIVNIINIELMDNPSTKYLFAVLNGMPRWHDIFIVLADLAEIGAWCIVLLFHYLRLVVADSSC